MAEKLAFFLDIPSITGPGPYTVSKKFGPSESLAFNYGITVDINNPSQHVLRAVCPGWLTYIREGNENVLRLIPSIEISIREFETIGAFVIKGVDDLLDAIIEQEWSRVQPDFESIDWTTIGGDPTEEEFRDGILAGEISVLIQRNQNVNDVGIPIAVPKHQVEFIVETTKPRRQFFGESNVYDPSSFWKWIIADNKLEESDTQFVNSFISNNFSNRYILEIRDEYNTPITRPSAIGGSGGNAPWVNEIAIVGIGAGKINGANLNRGCIAFDSQGSATISVRGEDPSTGDLLNTLDNQFVFWNSAEGKDYVQLTNYTFTEGPFHLVLHLTKPADWLAPQEAVFTNSFPDTSGRRSLARYSLGNSVVSLVDGWQYFTDLSEELNKIDPGESGTGQFWHIAGWSMDKDVEIDPNNQRTVEYFLQSLKERRLILLLWDNILPGGYREPTRYSYQIVGPSRAIHDAKHDDKAAIHQKIAVISHGSAYIGYCGGFDLWPDRLTDNSHSNSRAADEFGQHDIQFKVTGPAANELDLVLYQRWVDHRGEDPKFPPPSVGNAQNDTHIVQIARTVPDSDGLPNNTPYSFAANGDYTIQETLLRVISNANSYIYVEDQYFVNPTITEAIKNRLSHIDDLFLIVVISKSAWNSTAHQGLWGAVKPRDIARDMLNLANAEERIRFCYLENLKGEAIKVHAKLQIVDDVFVSCGSANIDILGFGVDPTKPTSQECNLMVVDSAVSKDGNRRFAQEVRAKLWGEHLNLMGDPSLINPLYSYTRYWKPKKPIHHVRFFNIS